jgi:hypothetical protein
MHTHNHTHAHTHTHTHYGTHIYTHTQLNQGIHYKTSLYFIPVTTPEVCLDTDGMDDPALIPDNFIDVNDDTVTPADLRPGGEPLTSNVTDLTITVHLTDDPEGVNVADIDIPNDNTNIDTVRVEYLKPGETVFTDLGEVSRYIALWNRLIILCPGLVHCSEEDLYSLSSQ